MKWLIFGVPLYKLVIACGFAFGVGAFLGGWCVEASLRRGVGRVPAGRGR